MTAVIHAIAILIASALIGLLAICVARYQNRDVISAFVMTTSLVSLWLLLINACCCLGYLNDVVKGSLTEAYANLFLIFTIPAWLTIPVIHVVFFKDR